MAMINKNQLKQYYPELKNPELDVSFLTVLKASAIKDLQISFRYKQNFVTQFIRTLVFILVFFLFSQAFAFQDLPDTSTRTVFLFYLAGLVFMMYDGVALWTPYNTVTRDLYNGTLEAVYQNPSSRYAYYLGGILASSIYSTVFIVPLFAVIFIMVQPSLQIVFIIFGVLALTIATFMSMGIIIGLSAILWKNVGSLLGILGLLFQFITGAIIPFASLPTAIQYVGYVFPLTWGLDILRFYIFNGTWTPILPIYIEWTILFGIFFFFTLTSRFLLSKVEDYSKKRGLHLL